MAIILKLLFFNKISYKYYFYSTHHGQYLFFFINKMQPTTKDDFSIGFHNAGFKCSY